MPASPVSVAKGLIDPGMTHQEFHGVGQPEHIILGFKAATAEISGMHKFCARQPVGVSLDIENYCTLRSFFDLSTLAGLSRRNLPEAGILLLFQM